MWRDQVCKLDKLVLERRRHVAMRFLALRVVVQLYQDAFLARTPWTTSRALGRRRSRLVVHADGRDGARLGVGDVQQTTDRFDLSLELRSEVPACRNPTTRVQEHLENRLLSDRR